MAQQGINNINWQRTFSDAHNTLNSHVNNVPLKTTVGSKHSFVQNYFYSLPIYNNEETMVDFKVMSTTRHAVILGSCNLCVF